MKTFLHYTKERELDEGILDKLSSGAESIGSAINAVSKNPFTGLLKKGAGGAAIGQAFGDYAERTKQCRTELIRLKSKELPRANARLQHLRSTGAPTDEIDAVHEYIEDINTRIKELGTCRNP